MKTIKHVNPPASREFSTQERISSKLYCHRKEEQTDAENLAKGTQESSKPQGLGVAGMAKNSAGLRDPKQQRETAQGKFRDSKGEADYLPWALLSEEWLP